MYMMCSFSSDESEQTSPKHRTCNSSNYILPQRGRSPWKVENNYSARNTAKIGNWKEENRGFPPKWVFVVQLLAVWGWVAWLLIGLCETCGGWGVENLFLPPSTKISDGVFWYTMSKPVVDEHLCVNMEFGEKKLAGEGLKVRPFFDVIVVLTIESPCISSHPRSPFQDPAIQRLLTVLAETIDEKSSYDMRQVVRYADTRKQAKRIKKKSTRHKDAIKDVRQYGISLKKAASQKLGNERRVTVAQESGNQT